MDTVLVVDRINQAIDQACASEMVWGRDDCALWCASILAPVLGVDLMEQWRGKYKSKTGAYRIMGRGGVNHCIKKLAVERNWAWVPASRAEVGDLGIALLPVGAAVVICRAPGWFVGRASRGFAALPAERVEQAWRVK